LDLPAVTRLTHFMGLTDNHERLAKLVAGLACWLVGDGVAILVYRLPYGIGGWSGLVGGWERSELVAALQFTSELLCGVAELLLCVDSILLQLFQAH
jgi:hypothetical protein